MLQLSLRELMDHENWETAAPGQVGRDAAK
jgi:hypothetical protein